MKKVEFNKLLKEKLEDVNHKKYIAEDLAYLRKKFDVFHYAAWCERNFEANLRKDYTRKTTFAFDFSIAEWYESIEHNAIIKTFERAITQWNNDIVFFGELIITLNLKAWEHHARKNYQVSNLYSTLYYIAKDFYFLWFDDTNNKQKEAVNYYFHYVD